MDWSKARAILLAAFAVVNLILAFAIWGPSDLFPGSTETTLQQQSRQLRLTLLDRGVDLRVNLPKTPGPMRFLHVEYRPTLDFAHGADESFGRLQAAQDPRRMGDRPLQPTIDNDTQAAVYRPEAKGTAARELRLENRAQVQQFVEEYLKSERLLPAGAHLYGSLLHAATGNLMLEYVPFYMADPVFSGYVKVEVSPRGIETVTHFWVQPQGYKEGPPKAVRPAAEAILRLAGHLEGNSTGHTVITDIRLGYYAGRPFTSVQEGAVQGWDTVPAWRISLDAGEVYYINAFNGELES